MKYEEFSLQAQKTIDQFRNDFGGQDGANIIRSSMYHYTAGYLFASGLRFPELQPALNFIRSKDYFLVNSK